MVVEVDCSEKCIGNEDKKRFTEFTHWKRKRERRAEEGEGMNSIQHIERKLA